MSENELTKDADYMLCALYKSYLNRRENGINKSNAKTFGSSVDIHDTLMKEWNLEDVEETCKELSRAQYISCSPYNNLSCIITLSDKAIIYMENRFERKVSKIVDYMSKIKSVIPFV